MATEVEKLRERLIALELGTREHSDKVTAKRTKAQEFLDRADEMDAQLQRRKLQLQKARRELAAAEQREAGLQQASDVYQGIGAIADAIHGQMANYVWGQNLLKHQPFAITFGATAKRWICGDEMGLGKTREAIGFLDMVGANKVIIIAEANICSQFAGEVSEYQDRPVFDIARVGPARREELLGKLFALDRAVLVANYEIFRYDKALLANIHAWRVDSVVVDEAHNLKSTSTANYKNAAAIIEGNNTCPQCGQWIPDTHKRNDKGVGVGVLPCANCGWRWEPGLRKTLAGVLSTRSVKNVMLTTGTPILNTPIDLYSLLHLVDPVLFRSQAEFERAYCVLNPWSKKYEWAAGGMDRLGPLIAGRYLARTLKDAGVELPTQREHVVLLDLDPREYPKQAKAIHDLTTTAELVLDSGETLTIMHLMSLITRKRQANVWPDGIRWIDPKTKEVLFETHGSINESIKVDVMFDEILQQHQLGKRQVVFSQFRDGNEELRSRLEKAGVRAVRFDGSTPQKTRLAIKANFDRKRGETPKWDVVLANYKTGGSGLNLTATTVTHIMDEEWNFGKKRQSFARNHRIGQTEETDVYVYRVARSIDVWMAGIIKRKENMVRGFQAKTDLFSQKALQQAMRNGEVM